MPTLTTPLSCILLVDDDETTNYVNKRLLNKMRLADHIEVVMDGSAALEYLTQSAVNATEKPRPDLMLVDIKMTGMDGFEFLERYQHLDPDLKAHKLVMLSSSASFYDLQRLQNYPDVTRHLAKPLSKEVVWEVISEFFPHQVQNSAPSE